MTDDLPIRIDLAKDLDVPPGQMSIAYRDYIREGTSRPGTEEPSLIKPAGEMAATQPGEVAQSASAVADEVVANTTASVASPGEESANQQATVTTAATEQSTVTRSTEQKSSLRESAARVPAAIRTTGS